MIQRRNLLNSLWFLPAVALFLAGLGIGLSSHQVVQRVSTRPAPSNLYQDSLNGGSYLIGKTNLGNVYIHADGSSDYFIARAGDFTPAISQSDIDNSSAISFVARVDKIRIDNNADVSSAHIVEKLVFYDQIGKVMATYVTAEYTAYLAGINRPVSTTTIFQNEWPLGVIVMLVGLIWSICAAFFWQRAKRRAAALAETYNAAFLQTYRYQQPYYVPPTYGYPNNPYGAPPPASYPSRNPPSEQFGQQASQVEPTQFIPPPYYQ